MGKVMKYPHKHTVRLSEVTEQFVQEEARMPDVNIEPAVLMRQLVEDGVRRRRKYRRESQAMKGNGN